MNEQQAWDYLAQYIVDSGLPYNTTLTKYRDSSEYQVEIKATFDEKLGFDEIDVECGWGSTVLLHLIENTEQLETKEYSVECQERYRDTLSKPPYTVTATRS